MITGDFGFEEIQTRPPQVFHKKMKAIGLIIQQTVDQIAGGADDLRVGVLHPIGEALLQAHLRDMEDYVLNPSARSSDRCHPAMW